MSFFGRLLDLDEVRTLRETLRAENKRLVLTNGCFDLLHAGHVTYLAEARALGDFLLVAINDDASVAALKGPGRPLNPAGDRARVLCALRSVDAVVIFSGERILREIEAARPDVYVKGGDYTLDTLHSGERAALEACGAEIHLLSLVPGKSTTNLLEAVRSRG